MRCARLGRCFMSKTNHGCMSEQTKTIAHALYGSLLGGAVGDAYGLPFEGMSPKRIAKLFKVNNTYHLLPFVHGGMVSDDTEHAVMTVQAYITSGGNVHRFRRTLKWRLVVWLFGLPAGVGLATGRSIFKMMFGFKNTGVYSAGNGGAMRSAVLGVLCQELDDVKAFVYHSTTLTHTDPKAYHGSLVVALLAWVACHRSHWTERQVLSLLNEHIEDKELLAFIHHHTPSKNGITGYMYDAIPALVQAWRQFRDEPLLGLTHLIRQGGDTDSTCAMFGGIVGVKFGVRLFDDMKGAWCEPVIRPKWLWQLCQQADVVYQTHTPMRPKPLFGVLTHFRNMCFLMIVLLHGFRRLFPPY